MELFICGWNIRKEDYEHMGVDFKDILVYEYVGKTINDIYKELDLIIKVNNLDRIIAHSAGCTIASSLKSDVDLLFLAPVDIKCSRIVNLIPFMLFVPSHIIYLFTKSLGLNASSSSFKRNLHLNKKKQIVQLRELSYETYYECGQTSIGLSETFLTYGNHAITRVIECNHFVPSDIINALLHKYENS